MSSSSDMTFPVTELKEFRSTDHYNECDKYLSREAPSSVRISRSDPAISPYLQKLRRLPITHPHHGSELRTQISEHLPPKDSLFSGLSQYGSDPEGIGGEVGKSLSTSSSYSSMRCRICFLSKKDTDKSFTYTGCHCLGQLQFTHRHCLQQWIDTKGSRQCECCLGDFSLDVSEAQRERIEAQQQEQQRQNEVPYVQIGEVTRLRRVGRVVRPAVIVRTDDDCRNSPRVWLLTCFIIMTLATICSAGLTVYAHNDMEESANSTGNMPADTQGMSFGLALTFLIFCGVLTLTVGCLWLCAELAVLPLSNNSLRTGVHNLTITDSGSLQDILVTDPNHNTIRQTVMQA